MKLGRISSHARIRMKQRGISQAMLECLLKHGRKEHDHHGGMVVYFDKTSTCLAASEQPLPAIERFRNTYAVVDGDGEVITVGRRFKRIRHH